MRQALLALMTAATLAGCGGRREGPDTDRASVRADWRTMATAADRDRLRRWRTVWLDALGRARASGAGRQIDAQPALFDPDRALPDAMPPAGDYHCRVIKLGAKRAGMLDYVAYPPFDCRVEDEGEVASFRKTGGSQRPIGLIFPDPAGRAVFLGTMMLGDETRAIEYGRDRARDMAGFIDRIGERRWRLALPLPAFESTLDLVEIEPVS